MYNEDDGIPYRVLKRKLEGSGAIFDREMNSASNDILNYFRYTVLGGTITRKQQRKMGYPYSRSRRRYPNTLNVRVSPFPINSQSKDLRNSAKTTITKGKNESILRLKTSAYNEDGEDYSKYILPAKGTPRMVGRQVRGQNGKLTQYTNKRLLKMKSNIDKELIK